MNIETPEELTSLLDAMAAPLLLLKRDTLLHCNESAREAMPGLRPGLSLAELTEPEDMELFRYSGGGSRVFSAALLGSRQTVRVTVWQNLLLAELLPQTAEPLVPLRNLALGILGPLTSAMSSAAPLLQSAADSGDPKALAQATQLSRGLFAVYRAGGHLRQAAQNKACGLSIQSLNLSQWLSQQVEDLRPLTEAAGRQLSLQLPARDYMCRFDPEKLSQALLNLLSNAIKFTASGGKIDFALRPLGRDRLSILVRDNGCGISPARMRDLFQPQKEPAGLPDPRCGMGLGLPLARAIVQLHGGNLVLESQPGEGTSVYLTLPRSAVPVEQTLSSPVHHPAPFGGFSTVLVELADALPDSVYDPRGL